jgi:hypothetical protein
MPKATVKDDIRSTAQARMEELQPLVEEYAELERIVAAIDGTDRATGSGRAAPRRALRGAGPGSRGHSARAEEAQALIRAEPGISVGALAEKMGIGTTYLYRLLPKLERDGQLRKQGRGYYPA